MKDTLGVALWGGFLAAVFGLYGILFGVEIVQYVAAAVVGVCAAYVCYALYVALNKKS